MINLTKPPLRLMIGRQGENLYMPLAFDAADWLTQYPDGAVSIIFERPDGEKYPVVVGAVKSAVAKINSINITPTNAGYTLYITNSTLWGMRR